MGIERRDFPVGWDRSTGADDNSHSFISSLKFDGARIHAASIYCSDGRWGEAFDELCHRHLQIPRYDRWAVPGGPGWLAASEDSPLVHAARLQLDFLVKAHDLERIVLVTHYGCAWYGHLLDRQPDDCLPAQKKDIQMAAATLNRWYPGLAIDGYLAMRSREWLSFHQIELDSRR